MKTYLLMTAAALVLCACSAPPSPPAPIMVGGDQDEHGCKASAGYSWSEVKSSCVRIWEVGIRLHDLKDANATSSGFLIFSDDRDRAELVLPNLAKPLILMRNGDLWTNSAKSFTLMKTAHDGFVLHDKSGAAIFGTGGTK